MSSLIKDIQFWILKTISFSSEYMISCIIKEKGFDLNFIKSTNKIKRCDICVESFHIEIKSIIDDFRYGTKIEEQLLNEIYGTLIREKIREHLNDSLQKEKIDIVILHVVSTSLGMGIAKYYKDKIMLFEDALRKSFEIVKSSNKKNSSFLTVIIFSYFIDDTKSRFVIHPFIVKYPIKSGFKPVVDHEKLSIDSIEIKI